LKDSRISREDRSKTRYEYDRSESSAALWNQSQVSLPFSSVLPAAEGNSWRETINHSDRYDRYNPERKLATHISESLRQPFISAASQERYGSAPIRFESRRY